MPNFASALKSEISRIARKELRGDNQLLKPAAAQQRSQISELKRRLQSLELQLKRVGKVTAKSTAAGKSGAPAAADDGPSLRFSAKGFGAQRQRLGLTAAQLAKILGVSQLSVYKWEGGQARPRAKQLAAIATLRGMGKREAAAKLES